MKKILLLVASLVFISTLSAQITQKEADEIVQQRLESDTRPCSVYAKACVQSQGITIATATGETLELAYSCWVYYVDYTEETFGKYLIVKESNGNLLEINPKNDTAPNDLEEWKILFINIPFEEYSLEETSCQWVNLNYDGQIIVINSAEELENYTSCTEGSYPEIDFSKYTLLLASGRVTCNITKITKQLHQISGNEYILCVDIKMGLTGYPEKWLISIIIPKLSHSSVVTLNQNVHR